MKKSMRTLFASLALLFTLFSSQGFAADNNNDLNSHDTRDGPTLFERFHDALSRCRGQTSGSPVQLIDGAFIWTTTDIVLNGRPNLSLSRHFNSYDARDGIFGRGWSTRCEKSLVKVVDFEERESGVSQPTINYIYKTAIGRRYSFKEAGNGSFISPDGLADINLIVLSDGTSELRNQENTTERYNALGQLIAEIDRNGNAVNYSYQNGVLSRFADTNGRHLEFTFDSSGHVSSVADHTGRTWNYSYNSNGTLASVTDPAGGVLRYTYVPINRPADAHQYYAISQITDASGVVLTDVTYSEDGRVSSYSEGENVLTYSIARNGFIVKEDSVRSRWSYLLDDAGNKLEIWSPSSTQRPDAFTYNEDAQILSYINRDGTEHTFDYDFLGRLTSETTPDGTKSYEYYQNTDWVTRTTSVSGRVVNVEYDTNGNVTRVTDPIGGSSVSAWSSAGDLITSSDPLGNAITQQVNAIGLPLQTSDALNRSSQVSYDTRGNPITIVDAVGNSTARTYDILDRLVRSTDALGQVTSYSYDAAGRMLQMNDPAGGTTIYNYDIYGRLVTEERADGSAYENTYRTDNLLETSTDPREIVTTYFYDSAKRLTRTIAGSDSFSYRYDVLDRLLSAQGGSQAVSHTYDTMNRLTSETQGRATVDYRYNSEGELIEMDALNESLAYGYDRRGLLETFTTPAGTHSYTYDAAGRLIRQEYPNGTVATMAYDPAGQLLTQEYRQLGGPTLGYEYDSLGRIISISGKGASDWTYQYDEVSRLVSASQDQNYSYSYDSLGNRLEQGGVYDAFNKLLEDNQYSYTYDEAGSLVKRLGKSSGEEMQLQYNGFGRLTSVEISPAVGANATMVARYNYDAFGRRVIKTVNGESTVFQWQQTNLIAEAQGTTVTKQYRYDGRYSSSELVAGGTTSLVLPDYLGSVDSVVSLDGDVLERQNIGPFGEAAASTGINNQSKPGQYLDVESGLSYNQRRYYDSSTGRYTRADPVGLVGGQNHYAYANSSPTVFVDPDGRIWFVPLAAGLVGGGINLGFTYLANGGNITLSQGTAAFASGALSGAVGAFAAPVAGSLVPVGAIRVGLAVGLNGVGNAAAQFLSNTIDPGNSASVATAFVFGLGGGVVGNLFPNRTMTTILQASYFAPSTIRGFILSPLGLGATSAAGALTASQNFIPFLRCVATQF